MIRAVFVLPFELAFVLPFELPFTHVLRRTGVDRRSGAGSWPGGGADFSTPTESIS